MDAATIAVAPPKIADMLALPRFRSTVPALLQPHESANGDRTLAASLLKCAVLKESDWKGQFHLSLQSGMERWLSEICPKEFRHLKLDFFFSDDVLSCGDIDEEYVFLKDPTVPTGFFAITSRSHDIATISIGNTVLDLEHLHQGAGWNLFRVLETALRMTLGTYSPRVAKTHLEYRLDYLREDPGAWEMELSETQNTELEKALQNNDMAVVDGFIGEIVGFLTPTELCKSLPSQFFSEARPRLAPIRRALDMCDHIQGDGNDARMLELGVKLWQALKQARGLSVQESENELILSCHEPVPVFLRWHIDDVMGRAIDDKIEDMNMNVDYMTDIAWIESFYANDPTSVGRAAECVQHTLKILSLCDQLLVLMDSEQPLVVPGAIKQNALINVLCT